MKLGWLLPFSLRLLLCQASHATRGGQKVEPPLTAETFVEEAHHKKMKPQSDGCPCRGLVAISTRNYFKNSCNYERQ